MISSGEAICAGRPYARSQGCGACGRFRFDTVKPHNPALVSLRAGRSFIANFAARPRRRSRPWRDRRGNDCASPPSAKYEYLLRDMRRPRRPDRERIFRRARRESPQHCRDKPRAHPRPTHHWLLRIIWKSDRGCFTPSIVQLALKILWAAVFAVGLRETYTTRRWWGCA